MNSALLVLGNATLAFADANTMNKGNCGTKCAPKSSCETNTCPAEKCPQPTYCEQKCKSCLVCPPPCECCKCNICPPTKEVNPAAGPCVIDSCSMCEDGNMYATVDFTWWTARQDSMEYAQTALATPAATNPAGSIYDVNGTWRPGFKVGLGAQFCSYGWDIFLQYTYFRMNNDNSTSVPASGLTLYDAYWFVNQAHGATPSYNSVNAHWELQNNVFDFEIGRNFWVSPQLAIRPMIGAKGFWGKQNFDLTFNGNTASTSTAMDNHMKNWGVGIRTGLDTTWHMGMGFSLMGDFALTGLWEQFQLSRFDVSRAGLSAINQSYSYYNVAPVVEWMFGLAYDWWSCEGTFHLGFHVAYEEQVWFNQNHFIRESGVAGATGGNLSYSGLTAGVRFDF